MRISQLLVWSFLAPSIAHADAATFRSGPERLQCYLGASDAGLEDREAIELCRGALSDAPARCAGAAIDRVGFSDARAVRLCRVAESMAPVRCAERLAGLGLRDRQVVGYCAALSWPLVAPRSPGAPACVRSVRDRTSLRGLEAMRLCAGSASPAPVECFASSEEATTLQDVELVDLCMPVTVSAPRVGPPTEALDLLKR